MTKVKAETLSSRVPDVMIVAKKRWEEVAERCFDAYKLLSASSKDLAYFLSSSIISR